MDILTEFLNRHRVSGSDHSHINLTGGKFKIDRGLLPEFYKLYNNALASGARLFIAEKPEPQCPIILDINNVKFERNLISNLINKICGAIDEIIDYSIDPIYPVNDTALGEWANDISQLSSLSGDDISPPNVPEGNITLDISGGTDISYDDQCNTISRTKVCVVVHGENTVRLQFPRVIFRPFGH